jgi:apolipoprotein D and lipocalin family protein
MPRTLRVTPKKCIYAIVLVAICAGARAASPLPLAPDVDLDAMYGRWYIVAAIPNWFEKGMVAPYDVYSKRADGDIREDFYVRRGGFDAPLKHFEVHDWVRPGTHNAHWRVQAGPASGATASRGLRTASRTSCGAEQRGRAALCIARRPA